MSDLFEGRASDSPYVEAIWRGQAGSHYAPICPASAQWHLLFLRQQGKVTVSVQGPLTQATSVTQAEGTEWFGITFPLGTFLPAVPVSHLLNTQALLPLAANASFRLAGATWQLPDYDNAETFVDRLVHQGELVSDPVVQTVLAGHSPDLSLRTVRRRFLSATGLTYKALAQVERAKQAVGLLEQGVTLIEAAYQAGYADQSHMTRALKHFIGHSPAQLARGGRANTLT